MANGTDLTPEQREARKLAERVLSASADDWMLPEGVRTLARALIAAQDEVAMWRKAVEEMVHEAGCTFREWECSQPGCSETHSTPCNCIKSRLEKV